MPSFLRTQHSSGNRSLTTKKNIIVFSLLPLSVKDSNIGYYAALRLMSYGVFVLLRTEMKRDFMRINKVIPGMLDGRNGGLAPIFGAYFILQEIMLYVTHTATPPT